MNPVVAGITSSVTTAIADHAFTAIFGLMALDALLPVGGELVMLYAGVLAAGAVAGRQAGFLGATLSPGIETYLVLVAAGSFGYLAGSVAGWVLGVRGGRPLVERHGRWLHLGTESFAHAEEWFARWGSLAVFLGRITPLVRSFISIPAGVFRVPPGRYAALTLLGSSLWCLAFAGAGWAVGDAWKNVHDALRYVDFAIVAVALAAVAVVVVRRRRAARA